MWLLFRRRRSATAPATGTAAEPVTLQRLSQELDRNPEGLAKVLAMWIDRADAPPGDATTRRDNLRSQIRPWLFLAPALLFLTVYLIYPVVETFRLSFFDKSGNFIGFANYLWAFGDTSRTGDEVPKIELKK